MRMIFWLINSLTALALAALSLGIPEECAFRYDIRSCLAQADPDQANNFWNAKLIKLAGLINETRMCGMATEAHLLGANRIHGPPAGGEMMILIC